MKYTEIEQAVMELCDAVPDFTYKKHFDTVFFCYGEAYLCVHDKALAAIAQDAKHWAAQHDWVPYTDFHSGVYSLYLVDDSLEYPAMGAQTEWREFYPLVFGSEELQWIRAVTEAADLMEES